MPVDLIIAIPLDYGNPSAPSRCPDKAGSKIETWLTALAEEALERFADYALKTISIGKKKVVAKQIPDLMFFAAPDAATAQCYFSVMHDTTFALGMLLNSGRDTRVDAAADELANAFTENVVCK